nr:YheC/YheD family protein [Brevibacillus fulvus]
MLDWQIVQKAKDGKQSYEQLPYYVEIGKELGLEPVFFHPRHVNLHSDTVIGHFWNGRRLVSSKVPIPKVIHNRVLSGDPATRKMIRELGRSRKVFNGIVVRDKLKVHKMLWDNYLVRPYLPQTVAFQPRALERFLSTYPVIYVKPAVGSVGEGVVRIEPAGKQYWLISSGMKKVLPKSRLLRELERWVGSRRFIIQEAVPLACYRGSTFDIRVSVQKNGERKWGVSGMVAKVANPNNRLSNLARGGMAVSINAVFSSLFPEEKANRVKALLSHAAVEIAKQYEKFFPSLADLGLDMGIDKHGAPYLIEINVRDQRYSFYKAGEVEMFKRTYQRPMEYAKSFLK